MLKMYDQWNNEVDIMKDDLRSHYPVTIICESAKDAYYATNKLAKARDKYKEYMEFTKSLSSCMYNQHLEYQYAKDRGDIMYLEYHNYPHAWVYSKVSNEWILLGDASYHIALFNSNHD